MLEDRVWDVLVVGAGPAGSAAARAAARRGVSVLLVERRPRVGLPVRCAEYVPLPVIRLVELDVSSVTVQSVQTLRTFLPGREPQTSRFPGVMIRRDLLDQALARQAAQAGAHLVTGLQVCRRTAQGVEAGSGGKGISIRAGIIIGADGPCSRVARWLGCPAGPWLAAAQVRLPLRRPLDHTRVYLHPKIPGGYGWVFPKGSRANLGVGVDPRLSRNLINILDWFREERVAEGTVEAARGPVGGGLVPVGGLGTVWRDNLLLAGDAAGTCHPISGAGVGNALISGDLAGRAAAEAVLQGNLSLLQGYRDEVQARLGPSLARAVAHRREMIEHWNRPDFETWIKRHWIAFREYYRP